MTETAKRLESAVRELESHLNEIKDLDPSSRELLLETISEIQAKLQAPGAESVNWSQRLSASITDVQASHPGLATMLTRVCDFLDQAGI
jgi:diadenosine tetraphosphate (Ap4A) HIT family hydrolase